MEIFVPSNEGIDMIQGQLPTGQLSFQGEETLALELGFTRLVPALKKAEMECSASWWHSKDRSNLLYVCNSTVLKNPAK